MMATARIIQGVLAGNVDTVRVAVSEGQDINERDGDGRTALHYAVLDGSDDIVGVLIASGADVNAADSYGWTALHYAAQEYRVAIANRIIAAGANVNAADNDGNTPLLRAVFSSRGRPDMIRALVSASADKNQRNHHGVSARELASTIANYDVASILD